MEELCGVDNTYSVVHLKRKIKEYFGKSILFTEEGGKPSVLTFRDNISPILHKFYNRAGKENMDEEKKSIISTAAQLINLITSKDNFYLSAEAIESDVVAPLQIGLGIQMHHHFGSRFLIDRLYNLGFCS